MSNSLKIKHMEIYNSHLYKSYGYEIRDFDDFIGFFKYSLSDIKRNNKVAHYELIEDMILYLNYRGHTEEIMQYKEPTEKKFKELNILLDTYKEDHEFYGTTIAREIYIDIIKLIQPQEVIDKLTQKIQFYHFILELLDMNKLIYNL